MKKNTSNSKLCLFIAMFEVVVDTRLVEAEPEVKGSHVFNLEDSLVQEMESLCVSTSEYSCM